MQDLKEGSKTTDLGISIEFAIASFLNVTHLWVNWFLDFNEVRRLASTGNLKE